MSPARSCLPAPFEQPGLVGDFIGFREGLLFVIAAMVLVLAVLCRDYMVLVRSVDCDAAQVAVVMAGTSVDGCLVGDAIQFDRGR